MSKVYLEVFKFNPQVDYEFYFKKTQLDYTKQTTLKEVLHYSDPDLSFDENIALRVNGICLFKDVLVKKLTIDFGNDLIIEPLCQKYVSKDLLLDKDAMFSFYNNFFTHHSFISLHDRYKFRDFLYFNTVSLQTNPDYLGDGFFMYIKWLIPRYPNFFQELISALSDPKNGVMSYSSIQNLLYIKDQTIDEDMQSLQYEVLSILNSKNNIKLERFKKIIKDEFKPFEIAHIKEKQTGSYALFNGYNLAESKPLLQSSKSFLEYCNKSIKQLDFIYSGGYFGKLLNINRFLLCNAYNLALAKANDVVLVFPDYESFMEAIFAKKHIQSDVVNDYLKNFGLSYDENIQIEYIGDLIKQVSYSDFDAKSVLYTSNFNYERKQCGIEFIDILENKQDFSHLELFNYEYCLKESARIRFAGIDMGVDFLTTTSIRQFRMFDTFAEKAAKTLQRDMHQTPTLFISQVALLSLGQRDEDILGLTYHKLKL